MKWTPIIVTAVSVAALGACATTSAGLAKTDVEETMASAKAPSQVATCAAETLMGAPILRNDGDHYWVIRNNGYGMPAVRWDFKPDGTGGTVIERRSTVYVSKGDDKIRACL